MSASYIQYVLILAIAGLFGSLVWIAKWGREIFLDIARLLGKSNSLLEQIPESLRKNEESLAKAIEQSQELNEACRASQKALESLVQVRSNSSSKP